MNLHVQVNNFLTTLKILSFEFRLRVFELHFILRREEKDTKIKLFHALRTNTPQSNPSKTGRGGKENKIIRKRKE